MTVPIIFQDDEIVVRGEWRTRGITQTREFVVYVNSKHPADGMERLPMAYMEGSNSLRYEVPQWALRT